MTYTVMYIWTLPCFPWRAHTSHINCALMRLPLNAAGILGTILLPQLGMRSGYGYVSIYRNFLCIWFLINILISTTVQLNRNISHGMNKCNPQFYLVEFTYPCPNIMLVQVGFNLAIRDCKHKQIRSKVIKVLWLIAKYHQYITAENVGTEWSVILQRVIWSAFH